MKGRRERRRKQLLDDLQEEKGYWKLKEEALDSTLWRTGFGGLRACRKRGNRRNDKCDFVAYQVLGYLDCYQSDLK